MSDTAQEVVEEATPGAPEGVVTEPAADEAIDAAQPETDSPEAQPRDQHGRFAPKPDGTPEAPDAAEVTDPAAVPPAATDADPTAAPKLIDDATRATASPFSFRAERQEHQFPDAEYYPGHGVLIPETRIPELKQLLSEGVTHRLTFRQHLETVRSEARGQVEEASSKAQAYHNAALKMFDILSNPEHVQRLAEDPEREIELLRRELALELRAMKPSGAKVQQEAPAQEADAGLQEAAVSALEDEVLTALQHDPKYAVLARLNEEDRRDILSDFQEKLAAFFDEHEGQIVLDRHKVMAALDREVKRVTRLNEVQEKARREAEALRRATESNVQRQKKVDVPPAVPTRGSPSVGEQKKTYKTADEWRKDMGLA